MTTPTRQEYRLEHDALGQVAIPADALYGVHTARALENFGAAGRPVAAPLVHAYGQVKLACLRTNAELGALPPELVEPIARACEELASGALDAHVKVDALQGGAGTSTNMNVNEVLANRALQLLGRPIGDYATVSPLDHVNLHQSTNDTYPTALRVAAITELRRLVLAVVELQEAFQERERAFAHVVKVGRTQGQDAVLVTLGRELGAWAEAIARDRWRLYKAEERLRVVNLGGTAVGTGLGAPRRYVFRVVDHLRTITGQGQSRAENLLEATQNCDVFVEVSGLLKALASNLLKITGDLRLLGSGPDAGFGELRLPARQAGSSIMPGKVNPVIAEAAACAAMRVFGADTAIGLACSLGSLELNPFMPVVADELLGAMAALREACSSLARLCVVGLEAREDRCAEHVSRSLATATALVPELGYRGVEALVARMRAEGLTVAEAAKDLLAPDVLADRLSPEAVNRLGDPGVKPS